MVIYSEASIGIDGLGRPFSRQDRRVIAAVCERCKTKIDGPALAHPHTNFVAGKLERCQFCITYEEELSIWETTIEPHIPGFVDGRQAPHLRRPGLESDD